MSRNLLVLADHLSDDDLLARLGALATRELSTTAELVAHLASLESRPSAYAAIGFGSLFAYCTQALHLSGDAACNRIDAAKICRRFPVILGLLGSGAVTLTAVRMLGRHLTADNHEAVLERAKGCTVSQIEDLIAELAPKPDVSPSIRRVSEGTPPPSDAPDLAGGDLFSQAPQGEAGQPHDPALAPPEAALNPRIAAPVSAPEPTKLRRPDRHDLEATAPGRHRVRFMIDDATRARFRRVQRFLRREIPGGDVGEIFVRALELLEAQVEREKLGRTAKRRATQPIRSATDRPRAKRSRYIPAKVKDDVDRRDGGQCAFVAPDGRRCTERTFLEFHHRQPYAKGGEATFDNISLRCRRHNQYEAEVVFGARRVARSWDHSQMTKDSIRTPPPGP